MGAELVTKVTIDGKPVKAKVLLETGEIIIRGEERLKIPFKKMKSLAVNNGSLSFLSDGKNISIAVGSKAVKWLEKIKNPKSVKLIFRCRPAQVPLPYSNA